MPAIADKTIIYGHQLLYMHKCAEVLCRICISRSHTIGAYWGSYGNIQHSTHTQYIQRVVIWYCMYISETPGTPDTQNMPTIITMQYNFYPTRTRDSLWNHTEWCTIASNNESDRVCKESSWWHISIECDS